MMVKNGHTNAQVWLGELATGHPALGIICIAVSSRGLLSLRFTSHPAEFYAHFASRLGPDDDPDRDQVPAYLSQVQEYLNGKRHLFDLPVDWSEMTPFQLRTLRETWSIPYGQLSTYRDLAARLGQPAAARAVGGALAANPMALVIPCHRVVGTDRWLHGFAAPGGLDAKAWLLALEGIPVRDHHVVDGDVAQP